MKLQIPIKRFAEEYFWLSNFYPTAMQYGPHGYITVEHAYQAMKCAQVGDAERIRMCATPGEAKRIGCQVPMIAGWDQLKNGIMWSLICIKFPPEQKIHLSRLLVETEERPLIEGNEWGDTYWGVCGGVGDNRLGKMLMLRRAQLRQYFCS